MPFANMLSITSNPFLSMVVWIVLLLTALYFARKPFHRLVSSLSRIVYNAMRLAAATVRSTENRLNRRNREVLMTAGLEKAERLVEREFDRINAAVVRDLEGFPNLHRQASALITRLDEDYTGSTDVLPSLPNWLPIIESIANISHSGDSMVSGMLAQINRTLVEQHKEAVENYRKASASRHAVLHKMLPVWRQIQKSLNNVGKAIWSLNQRVQSIDRYMDKYEQIRSRTDIAERMLTSSALSQFVISALFLLIAMGGIFINFDLIVVPIAKMVGDTNTIGLYKTSDLTALVIMLAELTMGLLLMESLRITRLFPVIGSLDDKMRRRMFWIFLALLAVLAGVESTLTILSERMGRNMQALQQAPSAVEQTAALTSMVPTVIQLVIGFILPFILAFVAIPLESFITSSRTVLGILSAGVLRAFAICLRLIGSAAYYAGRLVINLYDLAIFPSIWLEEMIVGSKTNRDETFQEEVYESSTVRTDQAVDHFNHPAEFKEHQE